MTNEDLASDSMEYWEHYFSTSSRAESDISLRKPIGILPKFCDNYLHKGAAVLDLGCGFGDNAFYLAGRGYMVCGVDIAPSAIGYCMKRFKTGNLDISFKEGTFECIPFPDNHFSGIICIAAFDHVTLPQAEASLREIRRVLTTGGVTLFTFDPPDMDEERLEEAERLQDGTLKYFRGEYHGMLFHRYSDEEIRSLLAGAEILSYEYSNSGARAVAVSFKEKLR